VIVGCDEIGPWGFVLREGGTYALSVRAEGSTNCDPAVGDFRDAAWCGTAVLEFPRSEDSIDLRLAVGTYRPLLSCETETGCTEVDGIGDFAVDAAGTWQRCERSNPDAALTCQAPESLQLTGRVHRDVIACEMIDQSRRRAGHSVPPCGGDRTEGLMAVVSVQLQRPGQVTPGLILRWGVEEWTGIFGEDGYGAPASIGHLTYRWSIVPR
jgi:hypothetical protein